MKKGLFFRVQNLSEVHAQIPGVWPDKNGTGGRIPLNAAHIIESAHSTARSSARAVDPLLKSAAFFPWVGDILMPHQRSILEYSLASPGYHAWSPPGSGKTLCGLIWLAAAVRQPKVVITKAAARGTWREEIR